MTYLDHAATTPMRPQVLDALASARRFVANPASTHRDGQRASALLETARERLAAVAGVAPSEVVFTSGGTESVNLALQGMSRAQPGGAVLVSRAEHHAAIETAGSLAEFGVPVRYLEVDEHGRIRLDGVEDATQGPVAVISSIAVNNEIGTVEHLDGLVELARRRGVPLHVDAVAAFGHVPLDIAGLGGVRAQGLAAVSIAAHKIGGPLGIGALLIARDAPIRAMQFGGGHERRLRAGTVDAAAADGFALAAELAADERESESVRLGALRDRVHAAFVASGGVVRGDPVDRAPGIAHATFAGVSGEALQFALDAAGFSVSTGSACSAGVVEPSHVLTSIGLADADASSAIRVTLGWTTTADEIDRFCAALPDAVERARRASPN